MSTTVVVESANDISVYLENPFIPANIDVSAIGIQGAQGYSLLSGNGVPLVTEGVNKDLYLDLDTGYLYKKISGLWVFQLTLAPQRESFTIDLSIIAAQEIELLVPPRPSLVAINFDGGIEQSNDGTAFYISGNKIKWDGISPISGQPYDFQTLLEVGDVMIISY